MNILQIKYAVEVARYGSINKAAEALYIAQPNLSRYIRELEADLGITIFKRTYRGMAPTPDGETFLHYAQQVLNQIDDIEKLYNISSILIKCISYYIATYWRVTKDNDIVKEKCYCKDSVIVVVKEREHFISQIS